LDLSAAGETVALKFETKKPVPEVGHRFFLFVTLLQESSAEGQQFKKSSESFRRRSNNSVE
jgi:hypothetical protein